MVRDFLKLPNGAILMFPISKTMTANVTVLGGRVVIPDEEVPLDGRQLLQGIDSQLVAAVRHLRSGIATG